MPNYDIIENMLDKTDPEINSMWMTWDKGDCSEIGLIEILLYQHIKKHKKEYGLYYNEDYDKIKLRYGK